MRALLDTNIISDLVRHPAGRAASKLAALREGDVCTSIIVAAELRYGAAKKGSARLSAQLEQVLAALDILPFEAPADRAYAAMRSGLEAKGQLIGGNDMLIAAHALSLGYAVVTDNEAEFRRVEGLQVVNWLR